MIKIVRLTRHEVTPEQVSELNRIYGNDIEIVQVNESLPANSKDAVQRFDEISQNAHVVEAVLPVNLLEAILKFSQFVKLHGIIIRAKMNREIVDGEAIFTFTGYERIIKVEIVTEDL